MTPQVLPTNKNKYILVIFMQACENTTLHNKLMTANTWAESICLHYQVPEGIQFDGTALNKAITSNIGLCLALDMPKDNIPRDHCGIFCDSYKPCENKAKLRAKQWCYYATNIGGKPAKDTKSWFNGLTTDLVSDTVTCSKKQKLSPATEDLIVDLNTTTGKLSCMSSAASEGVDAASLPPLHHHKDHQPHCWHHHQWQPNSQLISLSYHLLNNSIGHQPKQQSCLYQRKMKLV